jgi:hypothetical protein
MLRKDLRADVGDLVRIVGNKVLVQNSGCRIPHLADSATTENIDIACIYMGLADAKDVDPRTIHPVVHLFLTPYGLAFRYFCDESMTRIRTLGADDGV